MNPVTLFAAETMDVAFSLMTQSITDFFDFITFIKKDNWLIKELSEKGFQKDYDISEIVTKIENTDFVINTLRKNDLEVTYEMTGVIMRLINILNDILYDRDFEFCSLDKAISYIEFLYMMDEIKYSKFNDIFTIVGDKVFIDRHIMQNLILNGCVEITFGFTNDIFKRYVQDKVTNFNPYRDRMRMYYDEKNSKYQSGSDEYFMKKCESYKDSQKAFRLKEEYDLLVSLTPVFNSYSKWNIARIFSMAGYTIKIEDLTEQKFIVYFEESPKSDEITENNENE